MSTPSDNGWSKSAGPWLRLMEKGDPNRVLLLDEVMLGLCGDVRGLDVLDAGCGEGRFCRMLAARGARTIGIDPTGELIAEARRRQPGGVFHESGAEALPLDIVHEDRDLLATRRGADQKAGLEILRGRSAIRGRDADHGSHG